MTFHDIFKKSFLDYMFNSEITVSTVIFTLLVASLLAVYIFFIYQLATKKTFYSKNFNISIASVAVITTAIILTVQSNIVISLGMVGALSIVRFRTAIKDPLDLMFMFWSIGVGIICGAKLPLFAVILSIFLTIALFILNIFPVKKAPMILVVNSTKTDMENKILETVKQYAYCYSVKSRNMTKDSMDLTIELRTENASQLISSISRLEFIDSASLITHDGEVTF